MFWPCSPDQFRLLLLNQCVHSRIGMVMCLERRECCHIRKANCDSLQVVYRKTLREHSHIRKGTLNAIKAKRKFEELPSLWFLLHQNTQHEKGLENLSSLTCHHVAHWRDSVTFQALEYWTDSYISPLLSECRVEVHLWKLWATYLHIPWKRLVQEERPGKAAQSLWPWKMWKRRPNMSLFSFRKVLTP